MITFYFLLEDVGKVARKYWREFWGEKITANFEEFCAWVDSAPWQTVEISFETRSGMLYVRARVFRWLWRPHVYRKQAVYPLPAKEGQRLRLALRKRCPGVRVNLTQET